MSFPQTVLVATTTILDYHFIGTPTGIFSMIASSQSLSSSSLTVSCQWWGIRICLWTAIGSASWSMWIFIGGPDMVARGADDELKLLVENFWIIQAFSFIGEWGYKPHATFWKHMEKRVKYQPHVKYHMYSQAFVGFDAPKRALPNSRGYQVVPIERIWAYWKMYLTYMW